jgi:hypothetical protein
MKYPVLAVGLFLLVFSSPVAIRAQHIGFGGHMGGGFSGGFSGRGLSGHAIGHSFGGMFGRHPGGRGLGHNRSVASSEEPPLMGAVLVHGKVVQMPGPEATPFSAARRFPREPRHEFFFGQAFPFTPRRHFGDAFCGGFFPFSAGSFINPGGFDCFDDRFFSDSFFLGGFIGGRAHFHSFFAGSAVVAAGGILAWDSAVELPSDSLEDSRSAAPRDPVASPPEAALLQLTDGSMYGITDYWVEDHEFHYVTNYGAKTSLPLERVDMEATRQLNAERGASFVLRSEPAHHQPSSPANASDR